MSKKQILLFAIITFYALFRLGDFPIQDWDESLYGINAIEMLQTGDWINLQYAGQIDDWNLKPPLMTWAIAGLYSTLGLNEWSLRLPSAISIIIAFLFLYKIIRLYQSEDFAFWTCLILVSVKGWIGYHVGRTGDTDALFAAMLMAGIFYFLRFIDFKIQRAVLLSGLFFGLAFMAKGLAVFAFIPSLLLYALWRKQLLFLIRQKVAYGALAIFAIFPLGWLSLIYNFGASFSGEGGLGGNAFESMFWYDIVERFTNVEFINPNDLPTPWFFFTYLDARFNIWNYFLYLGLALMLFYFFFKKDQTKPIVEILKSPLVALSCCWAMPIVLFQSFANVQHHWYLAPVIPFIALLTYYSIEWIIKQFQAFKYVFFIVLAFTLLRQLLFFHLPNPKPQFIPKNLASADIEVFNLVPKLNPAHLLYLYHHFPNQQFPEQLTSIEGQLAPSSLIIAKKKNWKSLADAHDLELISCSEESSLCFLVKR